MSSSAENYKVAKTTTALPTVFPTYAATPPLATPVQTPISQSQAVNPPNSAESTTNYIAPRT